MEKIGEYREIERGTMFFSIAIQENITANSDIVIEITNTCTDSNIVFAKIKNFSNISGYGDRKNGDVQIDYNKTKDFAKKPVTLFLLEPIYEEKQHNNHH